VVESVPNGFSFPIPKVATRKIMGERRVKMGF
jgi:hypothetical protein